MKQSDKKTYMELIKERKKQSRVTTPHQLVGLELAQILEDEKHKSLFMKLAKEYNHGFLIEIAKNITEKKSIENKGAYFMRMLEMKKKEGKHE